MKRRRVEAEETPIIERRTPNGEGEEERSVLTFCTSGGIFWLKDESLEKADCLQVNLKVSWPDHEQAGLAAHLFAPSLFAESGKIFFVALFLNETPRYQVIV